MKQFKVSWGKLKYLLQRDYKHRARLLHKLRTSFRFMNM